MMSALAEKLWLVLGVTCILVHAHLPRTSEMANSVGQTHAALKSLLSAEPCDRSSAFLFTDDAFRATALLNELDERHALQGVSVFHVDMKDTDLNLTYSHLSQAVGEARHLREESWCVTVVVVSDDPAFLSAFAESSFKSYLLLVQTTRLLAFTSLPLNRLHTLHHLHKTVSRTNALLAVVDDASPSLNVKVYSMLPFTQPGDKPVLMATWSAARGLVLTSPPHLYPQKFLRFPHRPNFVVTSEQFPPVEAVMVDDPKAPGGKRLTFTGPMENAMRFISRQMNFTYTYVRPSDRSWGSRQPDGTYNGMIGQLLREEVEIAVGPFGLNHERYVLTDYSPCIIQIEYKIFAARGRPGVNPWGFLLPLSPLVWVAVLMALMAVLAAMLLLPYCLPDQTQDPVRRETNIFNCVRVLLQEDVIRTTGWWWWERVMLGVWMLMILVLTQSYVGNLMALLSVRYIDQPFQSLEDVLGDTNVKIILVGGTVNIPYYRTVKSGIFRELGDLLDTDRVVFNRFADLPISMSTLVRPQHHIIFDVDNVLRSMMAADFSRRGVCDYYLSRSSYLTYALGMLSQKNSLLTPGIAKGVAWLVESGLFHKWLWFWRSNSSSCLNPPRTITVNSVLSLTNLWGMFAVLGFGFVIGILVLLLECIIGSISQHKRIK